MEGYKKDEKGKPKSGRWGVKHCMKVGMCRYVCVEGLNPRYVEGELERRRGNETAHMRARETESPSPEIIMP